MRPMLLAIVLSLAPAAIARAETVAIAIPVPIVSILPGDRVAAELIGERRIIASSGIARTHFLARDAIVGKVARRVLPAGAAIPLNALREPYLVKDGQSVAIVFAAGGLSMTGTGVALQPGTAGELVSVRNADTGIVIRGVVEADGSVRVEGR